MDVYILEDHEVETRRTRRTVQQIQTTIMQDLQQVVGAGASLPEDAAKDLILQVTTYRCHMVIRWLIPYINPLIDYIVHISLYFNLGTPLHPHWV